MHAIMFKNHAVADLFSRLLKNGTRKNAMFWQGEFDCWETYKSNARVYTRVTRGRVGKGR